MKKISFLIIAVLISIVSLVPTSAFASSGVLDQSNGPGTNSSQIDYWEPCGQEFIPTMPTLIGVELYLYASVNAMGNYTRPWSLVQSRPLPPYPAFINVPFLHQYFIPEA